MDKNQIEARFFGMRINCKAECKHLLLVDPVLSGVEINPSGIFLQLVDRKVDTVSFHRVLSDDCKLILRPLYDITDEEVIEAFNAAGIYGVEVFRDSDKIGVIGRNGISAVIWIKTSPKPVGRFLEAWNNFPNKPQPEYFEYMLVDYLRSKHFCLPFCGLDPIAEGWAILEEKIPANEAQKEEKT